MGWENDYNDVFNDTIYELDRGGLDAMEDIGIGSRNGDVSYALLHAADMLRSRGLVDEALKALDYAVGRVINKPKMLAIVEATIEWIEKEY